VLGDDVFFRGIRKYLRDNAFSSVEIHDLRLAMEEVSGLDLNTFFAQWYFSAGHPIVSASEDFNPQTKELEISVNQTQDTSNSRDVFQFPLTVQFLYKDQLTEFRQLDISKREQVFVLQVSQKPDAIVYDPEGSLPWDLIRPERTIDQYRLLLEHQNTWLTRHEAVSHIEAHLSDVSVEDIRYALQDPHWELRQILLYTISLSDTPELIKDVISMANSDPDPRTRLAAVYCLGETGDPAFSPVFVNLLERSSKVDEIMIGLLQLSRCDLPKALSYSKALEQDSSVAILSVVASVYSMDQNPDHKTFFRQKRPLFAEEGKIFFQAYAIWASGLDDTLVLEEVESLKSLALSQNYGLYTRFYATYCLWVLNSILLQNSDLAGVISATIMEIRELTGDSTLTEWYRSFD
jgi:aminopeptidase N